MLSKDELKVFIKNIHKMHDNNSEDFKKIKYIVDGILLAQNSEGVDKCDIKKTYNV